MRWLYLTPMLFAAACAADGEPTTMILPDPLPAAPTEEAVPIQLPAPTPPQTAKRIVKRAPKGALAARRAVNAVTLFEWNDTQVFPVHVRRGETTAIFLAEGENVASSPTTGDPGTTKWEIGMSEGGGRAVVFIRALQDAKDTRAFIGGSIYSYPINLKVVDGPSDAMIRWTYPHPEESVSESPVPMAPSAPVVKSGCDLSTLNTEYRIDLVSGGKRPDWWPRSVADCGGRTRITFSATAGEMRAPGFYLVGADGVLVGLQPGIDGNAYVIPRIFQVGQLRLGDTAISIKRGS